MEGEAETQLMTPFLLAPSWSCVAWAEEYLLTKSPRNHSNHRPETTFGAHLCRAVFSEAQEREACSDSLMNLKEKPFRSHYRPGRQARAGPRIHCRGFSFALGKW